MFGEGFRKPSPNTPGDAKTPIDVFFSLFPNDLADEIVNLKRRKLHDNKIYLCLKVFVFFVKRVEKH